MRAVQTTATTLQLVAGDGQAPIALSIASPTLLPLRLVWPQLHQSTDQAALVQRQQPKPMPPEMRERMQALRNSFAVEANKQRYESAPQGEWFTLPLAMRHALLAAAAIGTEATRADLAATDWHRFAPPEQAAIGYAVRSIKVHLQRCTALAQRNLGAQ